MALLGSRRRETPTRGVRLNAYQLARSRAKATTTIILRRAWGILVVLDTTLRRGQRRTWRGTRIGGDEVVT